MCSSDQPWVCNPPALAACMLGLQAGVTTPGFDALLKKTFLTYNPNKLNICKEKPLICARRKLLVLLLISSTEVKPRPHACQACVHHSVTPSPSSSYTIHQQESKTTAMVNWAPAIALSIGNALTTEVNVTSNSTMTNDFNRNFQTGSPLIAPESHKYICVDFLSHQWNWATLKRWKDGASALTTQRSNEPTFTLAVAVNST